MDAILIYHYDIGPNGELSLREIRRATTGETPRPARTTDSLLNALFGHPPLEGHDK